jgi:zinc protease
MTSIAPAPEMTSIGGVRTFFSPVDGPVHAALTFRVGWADETLAAHGVSHLVEHLVLAPLGQPTFSWNAMTTAERTTFYCEGTAEQAAWFLDAVAANIRSLPLTHLDVERRLLRAEAGHRSSGLAGLHDLWRWGAQGHGVGAYEEFGLAHLTPERVTGWAARFLTAENSCLWTTGTPPATLELPRGEFRPAPSAPQWRATTMPGFFAADVTTVSFSAELREGQWAGLVAWLLEQRLMSRLRYTDGLTYGVHTDVVSVSGEGRRLIVCIDGLPDTLDGVARGAAEVVHALAQDGPSADELRTFISRYQQAVSRPEAVLGDLARLTDSTLDCRPLRSPGSLLAELEAVTSEQVRDSVVAMGASMLWCVPRGIEVPGVPAAPQSSLRRVHGLRFTPPTGQLQTTYVDVSDEGISLVDERVGGLAATILWSQCTAALGYDDGSRTLFGRDGFHIALVPERWSRYDELRTYVDRHLPLGSWAPQGPAPERARPRPLMREKPATSSSVWVILSVALWLFALMFFGVAFDGGVEPVLVVLGLVTAALGAIPTVHVVRRRGRRRAGLEPVSVSRYRGVSVWPTWLVGVGFIGSGAAVVAGIAVRHPLGLLAGCGVALACARELRRRQLRG